MVHLKETRSVVLDQWQARGKTRYLEMVEGRAGESGGGGGGGGAGNDKYKSILIIVNGPKGSSHININIRPFKNHTDSKSQGHRLSASCDVSSRNALLAASSVQLNRAQGFGVRVAKTQGYEPRLVMGSWSQVTRTCGNDKEHE